MAVITTFPNQVIVRTPGPQGPAGSGTGPGGGISEVQGDSPIAVANGTTLPVVSLTAAGISAAYMANDAVATASIQDGAVTAAKIAGGVINDGTVTEVTGSQQIGVSNGTTTPALSLAPLSVSSAFLAASSIVTAKINDAAVTTAKLDNDAVSTAKLADDAVTAAKLEDIANVSGSYTNANITIDGQGRITDAANGTGTAGEVQWGQRPGTLVRLFEDFAGGEETNSGNDWWAGDNGGSGKLSRDVSNTDVVYGAMWLDSNTATGGTGDWCKMNSGMTSVNSSVGNPTGHEIVWECRVLQQSIPTGEQWGVCIFGPESAGYKDDFNGWTSSGAASPATRVVLGFIGGQSNWRYNVGNATNLTLTSSDTGVAVSANTWTRLGIKVVKTATTDEWDYTVYVNGTSVGTGTLTTDKSLSCEVGRILPQSTSNEVEVDWMSCQFNRPAVAYIEHSDA